MTTEPLSTPGPSSQTSAPSPQPVSPARRLVYRAIIVLWIVFTLVLSRFLPAEPRHWWDEIAFWLFLLGWFVAVGWVYLSLITAAKAGQPQAKVLRDVVFPFVKSLLGHHDGAS
jgi:hypothetical protein